MKISNKYLQLKSSIMKTKAKILIMSLLFGGMTAMYSCNNDDDVDPGDPNDFCNVELCVSNANFKTVCIDEYNDCVALGAKSNEECAALATETCTI